MGGKGGGSDDFVPQNRSANAMLTEQQPTPRQKSGRLGTPYEAPTPQQLAEQRAQQAKQQRAPSQQRPPAAMDPNAIAGAGRGTGTSAGDIAAQSVLPARGRQKRAGPLPANDSGSV